MNASAKPKVLIVNGLGFNSHEELGYCFKLAGSEVDYIGLLEFLKKPEMLDEYNGLGLPGGFSGGDHLGAGQFVANLIRQSKKGLTKLEEKLDDTSFPVIAVCNSAQILSKLGLYPVNVGTIQNGVGKHMTGFWDLEVNRDCSTVWLDYIRTTKEPVFAPISHGEGRFYLDEAGLQKAHDMNLIAMKYVKGAMHAYFDHVRDETYNPNGSVEDIAGLAWNNNLALFPHFERLHKNMQRPDREQLKAKGINLLAHYGPTLLLFKSAVDFMKENM